MESIDQLIVFFTTLKHVVQQKHYEDWRNDREVNKSYSQPLKRTNRKAIQVLWLSQRKAKGNNAYTQKRKKQDAQQIDCKSGANNRAATNSATNIEPIADKSRQLPSSNGASMYI